jgi:transposase
MIPVPSGVRVWIATGHTDMRRGMNSLALQVQEGLRRNWPTCSRGSIGATRFAPGGRRLPAESTAQPIGVRPFDSPYG